MSEPKTCRRCGAMVPPLKTAGFCSRACYNEQAAALRAADVEARRASETRSCKECGKAFHHWGNRYSWPATCSPECRLKRANKLALDRWHAKRKFVARRGSRDSRPCKWCGRLFTNWGAGKRWPVCCSLACMAACELARAREIRGERQTADPEAAFEEYKRKRAIRLARLAADPALREQYREAQRRCGQRCNARRRELSDIKGLAELARLVEETGVENA